MSKQTYFNQRNVDTLNKLECVKQDLPVFCNDFFVGIQNRTSSLTRLNYAYDLRIFFDFLQKKHIIKDSKLVTIYDLEKLSAFDIEHFLDYLNNYSFNNKQLQCGDAAKERKLSAVRALIKYFFKKELLQKDIASKVSSIKIKQKNIVRLEIDEVGNLLDIVEQGTSDFSDHQNVYLEQTRVRDLAILTLFLGTGIRVSELVGLDVTDIDFKQASFRVIRKGGNASILYFNDEIAQPLKEYISWRNGVLYEKNISTNALFISQSGNRLQVRAIQLIVKKYTQKVTSLKKISPHKLRSTFGTQLYRDTQDIYVVAEVLGHKDVNTTKKHYAQTSEEIKRAAAKTVKLKR